jgi:hypothetical protein
MTKPALTDLQEVVAQLQRVAYLAGGLLLALLVLPLRWVLVP